MPLAQFEQRMNMADDRMREDVLHDEPAAGDSGLVVLAVPDPTWQIKNARYK
jgi:hypothetical protein